MKFRLKQVGKILLYILPTFILFSCNQGPEVLPAFYQWKSKQEVLEKREANLLLEQKAKKLYIKLFDVEKHSVEGAIPVAKTNFNFREYPHQEVFTDTNLINCLNQIEVVPVVFISNSVIKNESDDFLDTLAFNIVHLVNKHYDDKIDKDGSNPIPNEIQIDCDWTKSTKGQYFYLLTRIKELSETTISVTLRLYPFKFRTDMGVPPADRVMLMCYNLLNPFENPDKNSIHDQEELLKYLNKTPQYPIEMDIALPAFSWVQLYKNNQFMGLISSETVDFTAEELSEEVKPFWYRIKKDTLIGDYFIRTGDHIKIEESSHQLNLETLKILKAQIKNQSSITISFYQLGSEYLYNHDSKEISDIFTYYLD